MNLFNRIEDDEKVDFTNNLSVMLKSGMTINEALTTLADQTETKPFRALLLRVRDKVQSGASLSDSFAAEASTFGSVFTSLIRVGESSGTMDESLAYLAEWIDRDHTLKQEINSAMTYPKFVLSATFLMGGGLALYILPKLTPLFSQLRVELPLPTRILLATTAFIQHYWYIVIILVVGGYIGFTFLNKLYSVRKFFQAMIFKIPFFGELIRDYQIALIMRLFETLLKSGVSMRETIAIIAEAVSNIHYKESLLAINERVKGGVSFTVALADHGSLYSKSLVSILATGEKSGALDTSFRYLAEHYTKNLQHKTKKLPVILEPALLITIGLIVGMIALSIIMPIYDLTSAKF